MECSAEHTKETEMRSLPSMKPCQWHRDTAHRLPPRQLRHMQKRGLVMPWENKIGGEKTIMPAIETVDHFTKKVAPSLFDWLQEERKLQFGWAPARVFICYKKKPRDKEGSGHSMIASWSQFSSFSPEGFSEALLPCWVLVVHTSHPDKYKWWRGMVSFIEKIKLLAADCLCLLPARSGPFQVS